MPWFKLMCRCNRWAIGFLTVLMLTIIIPERISYAAPLGLPKNTAKIGYAVGAAYLSIDDPQGDTEDTWAAQPVNLIYTDWFVSDTRYWAQMFYYKTSLKADSTNIGQDVERYGLRFSVQKSARVIRSWAPWFGVGLDISQANYTLRHTKDLDGYLLDAFPDRSETGIALVFNLTSEWALVRDWNIAATFEQSVPANGDVWEFFAQLAVLYRY